MIKNEPATKVVCFGEILWDNLPAGRTAGGAPMNVAYHLNRLGAESQLISRIGNDGPGKALLSFCQEIGLPVSLIQIDQHYPTGEVNAKITANDDVVYDIVQGAAWDFIAYAEQVSQMTSTSDAFVFGSLAARNEASRDTLLKLLESTRFNVFDINLRAPHYSKEILSLLLPKADLLKLNHEELVQLNSWFYPKGANEQDTISFLQQTFSIPEILVTKGAAGASFYTTTAVYHGKAYSIKVADTVGAGDSFLAAFLVKKLKGDSPQDTLNYALGMGAFIASQSGACPAYTLNQLDQFILQQNQTD